MMRMMTYALAALAFLAAGLTQAQPPRPKGGIGTPPGIRFPAPRALDGASGRLVRAEFWSHTNDDNKDKDTGVYVQVRTADLKSVLAGIDGADSSGDGAKEYKDKSDNTIPLVIQAFGATFDQCQNFKFRVGIRATGPGVFGIGNDTWHFNGRVTLYFDNGLTLIQELGDSSLTSGREKVAYTNWIPK